MTGPGHAHSGDRASLPARRAMLPGITRDRGFYRKEGGTRKPPARDRLKLVGGERAVRLDGFSLAELRSCHWPGLLLGKRTIFFLPAGRKQSTLLLGRAGDIPLGSGTDVPCSG